MLLLPQRYVFSSKSQHWLWGSGKWGSCCCYHKGTYFQANHNRKCIIFSGGIVVVATTKVRIFKQITTQWYSSVQLQQLLLLPQRYVFSSKSQRDSAFTASHIGCCCYHKGTYFQANHNIKILSHYFALVVVATTKVRIFKQITTLSQTSWPHP